MSGLIGLDWGTSSLRAYWLGDAGEIRQARTRHWGIRQLPEGGFDVALAEITADWPDMPRLACGMIGSRGGWMDVPYVELPAAAPQLAGALRRVQTTAGSDVHIVPGLLDGQGPDVMRGEETQLVGAIATRPELAARSTWILPGTHSKWATVRDGAVTEFRTFMTGELFAVLRQHSILGAGIDADADAADPDAFAQGVVAARDSGSAGAFSRLFSARALMLDDRLAAASVPAYLSGLLIGEELRASLGMQYRGHNGPIQLVGDAALCARYRLAACHFGIELAEPLVDAAAHGLWQIACHAGLVQAGSPPALREASSC